MSAAQRQEHLELARLVADAAQGGAGRRHGRPPTRPAAISSSSSRRRPRRFDRPATAGRWRVRSGQRRRTARRRATGRSATLSGPDARRRQGPPSACFAGQSLAEDRRWSQPGHRQHVAGRSWRRLLTQDGSTAQPARLDAPPRPAASPALTRRPVGAQSRFGEESRPRFSA